MSGGRKPKAKARARGSAPAGRPQPKKQQPLSQLPAAPPPPRRRRRRNRAKGAIMSLSTIHPSLIPSLVHQGEAFPIQGMAEYELTIGNTNRAAAIFTNFGTSGTIGVAFSWPKAGGAAVATPLYTFTIPTIALADDAGGPTSLRAMKCGVDVVTNTPLLSRGGPVIYLNTDQRFTVDAQPSLMTATQWNNFYSAISAHPRRHKLDVNDFSQPRHVYAHVVDDPTYNDFGENKGAQTFDQFFQHVSIYPGGTPTDRPMSTIIYLFDTVGSSNNQLIHFSAKASFYSRWPLTSVPGQAQKEIPVAPQAQINSMHREAAAHSRLQPFFSNGTEPVRTLMDRMGGVARNGNEMLALANGMRNLFA